MIAFDISRANTRSIFKHLIPNLRIASFSDSLQVSVGSAWIQSILKANE